MISRDTKYMLGIGNLTGQKEKVYQLVSADP